jgi:hypothetical protein
VVVLCSTHSALAADFTPRLTSHGHPDLQGNWTSETATPFQREEELGEKKSFTVEEAQEWERNKIAELNQREAPLDGNIEAPEIKLAVDNTAENQFKNRVSNVLAIDGEYRTSIVVDPPNGRLPLRDDAPDNTFEGKMRALGFKDLDGPEMAGVGPRCLLDFGALPPAGPIVPISPNFLFVQNEDYVVLYIEAGAELRIIRLSEELLPDAYNQWRGDSIGYWEGNTLIVNTTSFHPQSSSSQLLASDQIEVQERFTIISENEIFYRFTITDPEIYTQPFTGELMLTRMPAGHKIYDYTCHEGNYSLPGILAGARRQEAELENSQN